MGPIRVALQRSDLTIDNFLCLAQVLKKEHGDFLLIFDSVRAEENFLASEIESLPADRASYSHLRAGYFRDDQKGEEHLYVHPQGFKPDADGYDSTIDLRTATTPHCRFELSGRGLRSSQ
jgi:hypothetical protein